MLEDLSTTQILAGLIGLYFLAAGTGLLLDDGGIPKMVKQLVEQPLPGYLAALVAFGLGGAIVAVHNDWSDFLSGFVSLIGWIALAEGVLMLAVRKWFLGIFAKIALSPNIVKAFGLITVLIGAALMWAGLAA
jgi:hypothetical protein